MTSQEADVVVKKVLASMRELTNESDGDYPNNQSLLVMVEAKK